MSVRTRLSLVLAAIVVLPVVATILLVGVLGPRTAVRHAEDSSRQAAGATALQLVQECRTAGDAAAAMAQQARSASPEVALAAARTVRERHPEMFAAMLTGDRVVAADGELPATGALAAAVEAGCADAGPDAPAPDAAGALVAESVPVQDSAGRTVATVVVGQVLDTRWLDDVRRTLGLDRSPTHLALSCPGGSERPLSTAPSRRDGDALASVAAGLRDTGALGDWVVARGPLLPGQTCEVSAGTDGGNRSLLGVSIALAALVVAVGGLLLAWLAGTLTRPVLAVAEAAGAVEKGDLSVRLPATGRHDELGRLATSFNTMTAELEQRVTELHESRDQLRANVARLGDALQRTHDLDGLLQTVLSAAASATGSARATAWLVEGSGVLARVSHPRGATGLDRRRIPLGEDLAGLVAEDGVPRRLGHGHDDDSTALDGPALAAPLRRGVSTLGVIVVERESSSAAYDSEDEAMLTSLAAPAGIAVDNVLLHREAQRLSVTDPLTGAGNLRHMTTTLAREVERAARFDRPLSLLLLDLDHFKSVNDTYGHTVGDAVLRELARRLAACIREVDTPARYGGEEFVVICPETDIEGAEALAERICEAVREEPFVVGSDSVDVTVSVGVAALPQHGTTSGDLVRAADGALYDAKRAGRDRTSVASGTVAS